MRPVLGLLFVATYVSGQCSKTSNPFRISGANDQLAVCVLPPNTPVDLSLNTTVPDTAICSLACDSGFDRETVNSRTLTCNGTTWVEAADLSSVCQQLRCPELAPSDFSSSPSCKNLIEGDACDMTCDSGYASNLITPRMCRGGVWTGMPLVCTPKVCPNLIPPADSTGSVCVGKKEGENCTFSCNGGATSEGDAVRFCTDGVWGGSPLTCTPAGFCKQLYSPPGTYQAVCARATPGVDCTFMVMPGYTIQNATRTCQANFQWDGEDANTSPLTCPPLAVPANADNATACASSPEGTRCVQQCQNGFVSNNQGSYTCHNERWIGAPLVCSPQGCPLLTSPDNSFAASCDSAEEGDLCSFVCMPGFKPTGHAVRVCHAGAWSGFSFQCLAATFQYSWVASSFGPCYQNTTTTPCGTNGVATRTVGCVDTFTKPYTTVAASVCNTTNSHEVSSYLQCALEPCPTYAWQFGTFGECSAECGTGYQLRSAACMSSTGAIVEDWKCPPEASGIYGRQACNTQACTGAHWVASEWSVCSGGCYDGQGYNNTRTRMSFCVDVLGNAAPVAQCRNAQPSAYEDCNTQPCAGYLWTSCPWEACTAQCNGGGTKAGLMAGQRQRNVFCKDGMGNTVSSTLCTYVGLPTPVTMMVGCNAEACTGYNWMTSPWTQCVGTGTQGSRNRTYHCHGADGSNVLNSACPQPPPPTQEACLPNSCPTMAPTVPGSSRPTPAAPIISGASQISVSVLAIIAFIFAQ